MGQDLPGSSHDPGGDRPSRPSRHDPRNECRQLSQERSCRQSARGGTSANARDNQDVILIVAPRQSNTVTKISLALSPCRDHHPLAATAEMAILIVAVFPSRLTRYSLRHAVQGCLGMTLGFLQVSEIFVFNPHIVGVVGFHGVLDPVRSKQSGWGRCTRLGAAGAAL